MGNSITLVVNEKCFKVKANNTDRLLDVLRKNLGLTGTKEGCGEGECGACSIILNGELVNSCLILFGQLEENDEIITIEGVANKKQLDSLQEHILNCGGTQCGVCTPGMILAAYVLLAKNLKPTREEIARGIAGNLCRCTGYKKIIDSIEQCSQNLAEG